MLAMGLLSHFQFTHDKTVLPSETWPALFKDSEELRLHLRISRSQSSQAIPMHPQTIEDEPAIT